MKKRSLLLRLLFIGLALVFVLSLTSGFGCGGTTPSEQQEEEEEEEEEEPVQTVLTVVCPVEPGAVGFPMECKREAGFYFRPGIEALMKPAEGYFETGEIAGLLATGWSSANDGTEWTLELRTGVKFHDGTDWDAEACKWNIELVNEWEGARSIFGDLTDIAILDTHTVKLTFDTPKPLLIADLFDGPHCISPTAYENAGETEEAKLDYFATNLVGTGPFELDSAIGGSEYNWVPYDDYWGDTALLESIEVLVIPEAATCKAMMLAGDAQLYVFADPEAAKDLVDGGGFSSRYKDTSDKIGVFPSATSSSSVYYDLKVRQALEHAIDREAIVTALSAGGVTYEAEYQLPMFWDDAYDPAWGLEYDPAQAITLLTEALGENYAFETTLFYEAGNELHGDIATLVQSYLAAVDITANIDTIGGRDIRDVQTELGWGDNNLLLSGYSWVPVAPSSTLQWFAYDARSRMQVDTYMSQAMKDLWDLMNATYDVNDLNDLHGDLMQETREESIGVFITNGVDAAVYANTLNTKWLLPYDRVWYCNLDQFVA